ncbi:hypothetical protein HDV63DRAFT_353867 [Trichoderma sp. SZMC 28014]
MNRTYSFFLTLCLILSIRVHTCGLKLHCVTDERHRDTILLRIGFHVHGTAKLALLRAIRPVLDSLDRLHRTMPLLVQPHLQLPPALSCRIAVQTPHRKQTNARREAFF